MRKKKVLAAVLGSVMMSALIFTTPASAHHHGRRSSKTTSYPVCNVDNCHKTGNHYHDGEYYCARSSSSGSYRGCCH